MFPSHDRPRIVADIYEPIPPRPIPCGFTVTEEAFRKLKENLEEKTTTKVYGTTLSWNGIPIYIADQEEAVLAFYSKEALKLYLEKRGKNEPVTKEIPKQTGKES